MTTHCSPAAGATTQQLVCQGPAGNPTTSTAVSSRRLQDGFRRAAETIEGQSGVATENPALPRLTRAHHRSGGVVATSRRRERELARRRYERRRMREMERRAKQRRRNTILGAVLGTV